MPRLLAIFAILALSACAEHERPHWVHSGGGGNLSSDKYECEREAYQALPAGSSGDLLEARRDRLALDCMHARGWTWVGGGRPQFN